MAKIVFALAVNVLSASMWVLMPGDKILQGLMLVLLLSAIRTARTTFNELEGTIITLLIHVLALAVSSYLHPVAGWATLQRWLQ